MLVWQGPLIGASLNVQILCDNSYATIFILTSLLSVRIQEGISQGEQLYADGVTLEK